MIAVRAIVHGRVHGVFFRDSVRERAQAAGVAGWVRNRPDGTVEAVFEGEEAAVRSLVAFCREGPPRAHVTHVDVEARPPKGQQRFEVR